MRDDRSFQPPRRVEPDSTGTFRSRMSPIRVRPGSGGHHRSLARRTHFGNRLRHVLSQGQHGRIPRCPARERLRDRFVRGVTRRRTTTIEFLTLLASPLRETPPWFLSEECATLSASECSSSKNVGVTGSPVCCPRSHSDQLSSRSRQSRSGNRRSRV